jgi:hypothetical protein
MRLQRQALHILVMRGAYRMRLLYSSFEFGSKTFFLNQFFFEFPIFLNFLFFGFFESP